MFSPLSTEKKGIGFLNIFQLSELTVMSALIRAWPSWNHLQKVCFYLQFVFMFFYYLFCFWKCFSMGCVTFGAGCTVSCQNASSSCSWCLKRGEVECSQFCGINEGGHNCICLWKQWVVLSKYEASQAQVVPPCFQFGPKPHYKILMRILNGSGSHYQRREPKQ